MPIALRPWCLHLATVLSSLLLLSGCATPTAVTPDTEFRPDEGLVTLRLVDVGDVPIRRLSVVEEATAKEHVLRPVRFGQTSSMTYVGRLPAGRYRPKELRGSKLDGLDAVSIKVPLAELTGQFDVEARRVTDLGTMVFMRRDDRLRDVKQAGGGHEGSFRFALPLDPTPVPTEALLARFPQLAQAMTGKSALGWVAGTVPTPIGAIADARRRAVALTRPSFVGGATIVASGPLGVVATYPSGVVVPHRQGADTVHAIESVIELKDGRWLAGGEEGYLAVSNNAGASWERLALLGPDAVVIHLSQAADGRLFMVADLDREAVVYESAAHPIQWKVNRRLPSDREQSVWNQEFGEAKRFLPDHAGASRDRLVVLTRPSTLWALDLASGQWSSHETPRNFNHGMQVTPDGYVVGMFNFGWIYGSVDYGKTWNRLEAWVNMSHAHFVDRRRGMVIASEMSMTGFSPFHYRHTEDGGKTWKAGERVDGFWTGKPLWADAAGTTLFTTVGDRVQSSTDEGRHWK
jgi:hypothetical protein